MTERGERDRKLQTKPCWSWSGAEALDFARQTHDLERLVAMLPEKKSSADEILNFVVDLRARFQRWMHQDEFGPTRRQQTAALRALKKSLQTLQRQLAKGAILQRGRLDTMLRAGCLDHIVVTGEQHLRHILQCYMEYYNTVRTHLSLGKDAPIRRVTHSVGRIEGRPVLGGLHHQYVRI